MKHHISHILQEKVREASDLLYTLNQGYLVLGFLPILSEKSRFGDRSDSGKS